MADIYDSLHYYLIVLFSLMYCLYIAEGHDSTTLSSAPDNTTTRTLQRASCELSCHNGGSCRLYNGESVCKCTSGYHGYRCESLDDIEGGHDDTISLVLSLITSTAMIGLIIWGMIRLSHRRNARRSRSSFSGEPSSRRQSMPERARDASEIRSQSSLDPEDAVPSLYSGIVVLDGPVPYTYDLHPPPDYYSAVALYVNQRDSQGVEDKGPESPPSYEEVMNCRAEDYPPQVQPLQHVGEDTRSEDRADSVENNSGSPVVDTEGDIQVIDSNNRSG